MPDYPTRLRRARLGLLVALTPVVHNGPYEYSVPGAPKDFVMQTDAEVGAKKH